MRQELRSLREGWNQVRKIEAQLMQPLTIQESVRQKLRYMRHSCHILKKQNLSFARYEKHI